MRRAAQRAATLFLSALGSLVNLGKRLLRRFWAFLGRCGLALRHLLTIFIWRPLRWISRPFVRAGLAIWAFIGRCGLALRHILTVAVWRPLLFITWPLRWLYGKALRRPLAFAALSLRTFGDWFFREALPQSARALALGLVAALRRLGHRLKRWSQARTESEGSRDLEGPLDMAPRRLRVRQITTALIAASVILILGLLSGQAQQPLNVAARSQPDPLTRPAVAPLLPKMTLTPTPLPSPTPTSTPSPTPVASPVELAAWPTPDPLSKGGSVAFSQHHNGNSDLYALTLSRSAPIRLTDHPAADRDPAWSPDGRYLAFASDRDGNWELYILDFRSGDLRRLTNDPGFDGGPSWSPDGEWLVFESYRQDNLDLYIVAADAESPPIRLTENPAQDFSPAWSPDGRHIAFTSWRDGNKDIYLLDLDLAYDEQALNLSQSPDREEDHPAFSPGGETLAFQGRSDGLELIYTLPLESYRPAGPAFSVGQGRHPSWSPDGSSLVYAHGDGRQSYIIASSVESWNVAPQAFAGEGWVNDLAWSGAVLPRGLDNRLAVSDQKDDPLYQERLGENSENVATTMLQEVDVDAPAPYLSDQVDDSFRSLRQRVIDEAGWDFLGRVDNMFAFLTSGPLPGDTTENWNKAARAFDFYYRFPISVDAQVEVVREDLDSQTYWRVYLKTARQDGSQGEPLRQLPWDFTARYDADPRYYDQGGRPKEQLPGGYYLDFTALAEDYGWRRVPALANWRTFFHGIRYWHFEKRDGLAWEEAMLELYTADELAQASELR